jgi:hypothetical protein
VAGNNGQSLAQDKSRSRNGKRFVRKKRRFDGSTAKATLFEKLLEDRD